MTDAQHDQRKAQHAKYSNTRLFGSLLTAASVLLLAYLIQSQVAIPSQTGAPAVKKPFRTVVEFYPFYKTEHKDTTCRQLHVVGTSLSMLTLFRHVGQVQALIVAITVGYVLCGLCAGLETGAVEAAAVVTIFLGLSKLLTKQLRFAVITLILGYGFAWVGHFAFEHNKPASFIYPTFSYLGDMIMLFNVYTGREPGFF